MYAFGGNACEDLQDQSTDAESSDAFGEEDDYSEASDYDEDKATREQRRKEFDQLCRQNRFGEAPSISSDESDSDDSFDCDNPDIKSRFVVSDGSEEKARPSSHHDGDARFLSYHPGAEAVEIVGAARAEAAHFVGVDKSLSLSLNQIPIKHKAHVVDVVCENKRCDSDPSLATSSKRVVSSHDSPPSMGEVPQTADVNGLNILCQQQRQWLDELRADLFRSKEESQRETRLLTHKLMLSEGEKRQMDEQNRALRQRLADEQLRIASLEQQLRDESRHSQRLEEEKLQSERDAIAAREEANSLQDQLISLTRASGLYQERNAIAEKWAAERTSLLNQVETLRMQLADRQGYVERTEDTIRQLEERYRQALSDNDQLAAEKRRAELERDRMTRDLELAHTEARLAVDSADSAKTSTPRVALNNVDTIGFDSSPLISATPRFLGGENMLKIELAKALAANRDNIEKIRSLETKIAALTSDFQHVNENRPNDYEDIVTDRDNLKVKLSDILEENRRLTAKLRDFVAEADREKQAAIESCRTACMRLHDDAKRSLMEVHRHEIEELQKKHEVAVNQLLVEMRGLSDQVDDAKRSYLQACSEKGEAEEAIRSEYDAKLSELRSLMACETSALQEKLLIKEKQLEASRLGHQKALRSAMGQINTAIETTASNFRNQISMISAKLAALYGRFDTLSVTFNRLSFHILSSKQQQSKDPDAIPNAVTQLRAMFLETAQRMREVYVAHQKAADERNRYFLATMAKSQQQQQQRRILAARNDQQPVSSNNDQSQ